MRMRVAASSIALFFIFMTATRLDAQPTTSLVGTMKVHFENVSTEPTEPPFPATP